MRPLACVFLPDQTVSGRGGALVIDISRYECRRKSLDGSGLGSVVANQKNHISAISASIAAAWNRAESAICNNLYMTKR